MVQIITPGPTAATLRQQALNESLGQAISGYGEYEKTQRQQALSANEQALSKVKAMAEYGKDTGRQIDPETFTQLINQAKGTPASATQETPGIMSKIGTGISNLFAPSPEQVDQKTVAGMDYSALANPSQRVAYNAPGEKTAPQPYQSAPGMERPPLPLKEAPTAPQSLTERLAALPKTAAQQKKELDIEAEKQRMASSAASQTRLEQGQSLAQQRMDLANKRFERTGSDVQDIKQAQSLDKDAQKLNSEINDPKLRTEKGMYIKAAYADDRINKLVDSLVPPSSPNETREQRVARYDKLSPQQVNEIVTAYDTQLKGGNTGSTEGSFNHIKLNSAQMALAGAKQFLNGGTPSPAGMGEALDKVLTSMKAEGDLGRERIAKINSKLALGHKELATKDPERFAALTKVEGEDQIQPAHTAETLSKTPIEQKREILKGLMGNK